jgi:RNA polymerase sigma-70 factor (ECF subfamily)
MVRDQERHRVRDAVSSLPEDLRDVVLLCEFSGMSYAEIAGTLSIPEGTVGSRRHRALKLLRSRLSAEEAS